MLKNPTVPKHCREAAEEYKRMGAEARKKGFKTITEMLKDTPKAGESVLALHQNATMVWTADSWYTQVMDPETNPEKRQRLLKYMAEHGMLPKKLKSEIR